MGKHQDLTFKTQIGQKATVKRDKVRGEDYEHANRNLAKLGDSLNPVKKSLKYMGSAAVHIYWNATLEQVFFVSQTQSLDLYACPEILATKAFDDLLGTLKEQYGHRRSRLRSGF